MPFTLPSPETEYGARIAKRLNEEITVWLTSVDANGVPQPNPIWFLWDGQSVLFYSLNEAARLKHIAINPHVSLNFDTDGEGDDLVILTGHIRQASDVPSVDQNAAYLAKYGERIKQLFGEPAGMAAKYSVALRFDPEKVRGRL
jgi:PPOX class probable F420-dependent enzyme